MHYKSCPYLCCSQLLDWALGPEAAGFFYTQSTLSDLRIFDKCFVCLKNECTACLLVFLVKIYFVFLRFEWER